MSERLGETMAQAPSAGVASKASAALLDIRDLSVAYRLPDGDVSAVRGVDLALHAGQIVGLAGESGSGKSTLAYGAVRLLRPPALVTGGSVTYRGRRVGHEGVDVLAASPARLRALRWREIAIVFQSAMSALNPVLRVGDQLIDALDAHLPLDKQHARERAEKMIELVGIPTARLRSYPHELSGGMRQRAMIAMALAVEPEVVIMDEPTTGLDVVVQAEILRQILELKDELGFSVLLITHDLSLLLQTADQLLIMYAGKVVESGSAEQLRVHPVHPYTRALMRSFPRLRGPRHRLAGIPGSPPDLRERLPGCPFVARCGLAREACSEVDMRLIPAQPSARDHLTACPFETGAPSQNGNRPTAPVGPGRSAQAAIPPAAGQGAVVPSAAGQGAVVLEAVELGKEYHTRHAGRAAALPAVQGVSFALRQGSVLGLVGASGSGKSTIAKLLAGQERRSAGRILLDGAPIEPSSRRAFRAYKSDVQLVFQDPFASLNPLHTVRYHLERALSVHGKRTGRQANARAVDELLEQVQLAPAANFRDAYPHELSGGQRQRVAIARALAAAPRVLLADEPVSMLDVSIRLGILDLIADLRRTFNLAVLYITHDIASARYFADEILVLSQGRIVERGSAEQVTQNPAHSYTQLLIASSPDPDRFAEAALKTADPGGTAHPGGTSIKEGAR